MSWKNIAIDGPSGAGKSTLSMALAQALGFLHVDTGAIYRAVAVGILARGIHPAEEEQVVSALPMMEIEMRHGEDGKQRMLLDGRDVTEEIRIHAISQVASQISAYEGVRDFLLEVQRTLARRQNVVMDGRDIGTVVLPDADVKIFLTASAEIRARRRQKELLERGQQAQYETVLRDIRHRDHQDENRAVSPLRQAEDAVLLDTGELTLDESVAKLLSIVRERLTQ